MNRLSTHLPQTRPNDGVLIERAKHGDRDAFEEIFRRHRSQAVSVAARICGARDAEDVAQAAFISIWRNLARYEPDRASVKTWLLSIVRFRAIDALRARPKVATASIESLPEPADPVHTETIVAKRHESAAVREAVAELPAAQREVLELAYFNEFSQSEISRSLEIPLGTVKGRTRLGMQKLPASLAGFAQANVAKVAP